MPEDAFHIIGDQDTIVGFRFAGVTGTAVESQADAREAFSSAVAGSQYRILLVTDRVADWVEEDLTQHRLTSAAPYIVEVADIWGTPVRRKGLEQLIQEAVGIKIVREDAERE